MPSKRVILWSAVALVMAFGLLVSGLFWLSEALAICDAGSPTLAQEWAARLEGFPDVETALASDEHIWGRRFENGEWVFGLSQNSHGSPRTGGTVVIKESRRGVRVFFGHVCGGPGPLWWRYNFEEAKSLDEFYRRLAERRFTEYALPAK
jgi:hypothetical protein